MHKRFVVSTYRILFGVLAFTALITEVATLVERGQFQPLNFFSYFTVEANSFAAVILVLSGLMVGRESRNPVLAMLRGASTVYMATTGIVFSILLSGLESSLLTAVPWDNIVLHYIMPIVVVADWFLSLPGKKLLFKRALIWLIYPLCYVIYSLARGHRDGWYPYPFLNPTPHGYGAVLITSLIIAVGLTGFIAVVAWSAGLGKRAQS